MLNSEPLVSIHFPTYNHEIFLESALLSAINQTYKNIEICISDDASTDKSVHIIREYKEKYPDKIKFVHQRINLGMAKNLNACLEMCSGEYICFLSGEDLFHRNKIELQLQEFLKSSDLSLLGHFIEVIDESSEKIGQMNKVYKPNKGPREWIKKGPLFGAVSIMLRKEVIPKRGFDERIPVLNDQKFWIDCLHQDKGYGQLELYLSKYRKTKKGATNDWLKAGSGYPELYSLIESDYPEYRKECKKGINFNFTYGKGMAYRKKSKFLTSSKFFLISFFRDPTLLKGIIRIFENVLIYGRSIWKN
tara:strand:+ start:587 stop:1501 length:915 start_codon:yes stop_codon:yes gene_type:complete